MSKYQLAQLNIATMTGSLEAPEMADFVNNLERINALAEDSPGFVWRLKTDDGDATGLRPLGENILVNLSVWQDAAAPHDLDMAGAEHELAQRRGEWFARMAEAYVVLWWVPRGHVPDVTEAYARLEELRAKGPTAAAFGFRSVFDPPDAPTPGQGYATDDVCPAT